MKRMQVNYLLLPVHKQAQVAHTCTNSTCQQKMSSSDHGKTKQTPLRNQSRPQNNGIRTVPCAVLVKDKHMKAAESYITGKPQRAVLK